MVKRVRDLSMIVFVFWAEPSGSATERSEELLEGVRDSHGGTPRFPQRRTAGILLRDGGQQNRGPRPMAPRPPV